MVFTAHTSLTSFWSDILKGIILIVYSYEIPMKHDFNQTLTKLFSENFDKFIQFTKLDFLIFDRNYELMWQEDSL